MQMTLTAHTHTHIPSYSTRTDSIAVRIWLYATCCLIFTMVIVGGATRLTDSGLSITEWQPILGAIPPLNAADWQIALDKYRQIPEYQLVNKGMSMSQFQFIYWWEWGHRFLGRFIGLFVFIPLVFFWVTGRLEPWIKPHLVALFILGGLQGAIGWWMVSSGLTERVDVSQYRLATHLTMACIIFAYTLWLACTLSTKPSGQVSTTAVLMAPLIVFAVFAQIFLGALVAGLDAGLYYNEWPLMEEAFIPEGLLSQTPVWRNFFENELTVQFIHRMSAYALLVLALVQAVTLWRDRTSSNHASMSLVIFLFVMGQAAIGIYTLLQAVPLSWGLYHQGGALIVLAAAIIHWQRVRTTALSL